MHVQSLRAVLVAAALGAMSACGGGGGGGGSDAGTPAATTPTDPTAGTMPAGDSLQVAKALIDRTDETSEPVSLAAVGTADRSETGEPAALR